MQVHEWRKVHSQEMQRSDICNNWTRHTFNFGPLQKVLSENENTESSSGMGMNGCGVKISSDVSDSDVGKVAWFILLPAMNAMMLEIHHRLQHKWHVLHL